MEEERNNENAIVAKAKGQEDDRGGFKYVPEEIVTILLAKLPLDSLLRFRCVSKQLCGQISKHRKLTKVKKVIVHTDQNSVLRSVDENGLVEDIEIKVDETITRDNDPRIYGSCNEFLLIRTGINLFLWHPSSRRSHGMLTNRLLLNYPRDRVIPGLCYDSENDEYKVVLGLNHHNWRERNVRVGSFKTKTWSRLDILDFNIRLFNPGPTLNNYLHWWSSKEIVWFDPKIDKFTKISPPEELDGDKDDIFGLGVLDGCLCVVGKHLIFYKYFGVNEAWEIIYTFPFSDEYAEFMSNGWLDLNLITPLFFTDEKKSRFLIRVRRTEYEHYFCLTCDYYGNEGPEQLSDEYVIIAYDAHENSCNSIVATSFEQIAYDGDAVYEETIVSPVSMGTKGGGKKVWKLKVENAIAGVDGLEGRRRPMRRGKKSTASVVSTPVDPVLPIIGEQEKNAITGVDGWETHRRPMRKGKKSTAAVVSAPVDQVVHVRNAFDLLNDSE